MQKLAYYKQRLLLTSRGSVLVSAVAISILMAIAGVGFIMVNTTSLNNETAFFENAQAFRAAESGIWAGARWLRIMSNFPQTSTTTGTVTPFGSSPISINNMEIYVSVQFTAVMGSSPSAAIISEVYKGGKSATYFKKRLIAGEITVQDFGAYCTFFNSYQPDYTNYVVGQYKQFASFTDWGGFANRTFQGRFHMNNCYIKLNTNAKPGGALPVIFQNGLVTVATPTDPAVLGNYTKNYGISATSGHNYNSGVWADWWPVTTTQLDQIFTDRYVANTDQIALPAGQINATAVLNDTNIDVLDKIELPTSTDNGEEQNHYRPTLIFNGASATYQYQQGGVRLTNTYSNLNGKIFCCHNNLNVVGTVKGRVTVTTDPGTSIMPIGNIVTSDYNTATGTINDPTNTDNIIGLAPGKHIRFNNQWNKFFAGDASATQKNVANQTTAGTMHICASIIATGIADVIYTTNKYGTQTTTKTEQGTEYWDLTHAVMYSLKIHGNHILGGYRPVSSGYHGVSNGGCNGTQSFTYDSRLRDYDLQPPAYPKQNTIDNLWVLRIKGWVEENKL